MILCWSCENAIAKYRDPILPDDETATLCEDCCQRRYYRAEIYKHHLRNRNAENR